MENNKYQFIRKKILPKLAEIFIPAMIASLLCIGFTLMTGNAFSLYFNPVILVISVAAGSLFFASVHNSNNLFLSIGVIALTVAALLIMIHYDFLHLQMGLWAFLYYVKRYVYYSLPGDYPYPLLWKESVLTFLIMYDLIAASVTTFILSKRKWMLLPGIFFLPLLWCSIANVTVTPTPNTTVIASAGVIMLLLAFAYRKKEKKTSQRSLLIVAIPVLLYAMITAMVFPVKFYKKDRLANDILFGMKDLVSSAGDDGFLEDIIDKAIYGNEDPHPLSERVEYNQLTALRHADNDLSKVGPFDPPEGTILSIRKEYNSDSNYPFVPENNGSYDEYLEYINSCYSLYLKIESLETYQSNTLSKAYFTLDQYNTGTIIEYTDSPYLVSVDPLIESELEITPYYNENYFALYIDQRNNSYIFPAGTDIEFEGEAPPDDRIDRTGNYPAANVPVKAEDVYTDTYENAYVYGICLAVPDRTRDALISGGNLPDWYLDIFYGRSKMSDCDKVRAVTEYVRGLHPYDVDTVYPPKGSDFVPWFVNSAESGICVHYATTSMLLLRMIGIPTRYVRGYVDPRSYPGATSIVYASQAHGWFEFYVPGYGWIMGDPTPGMEKYAKYYDIDAVALAYPEIEEMTFSRAGYDSIEELPEENVAEKEAEETAEEASPVTEENGFSLTDLAGLLRAILVVVLVIASLKLLWCIFWLIKVSGKDMGGKIIEYYHYYTLMNKYLMKGLPKKSMEIVYKVTFSHEDITADDLKTFIKASNKSLALMSARLPFYKKIFFRLLELKISP